MYRHSDTLVGESFGWMNRGKRWDTWVRLLRPDLVVLSVGPHIRNISSSSSYLDILRRVHEGLRELHREGHTGLQLVWRTILPGGCGGPVPLRGYPAPTTQSLPSDKGAPRYNWDHFSLWNDVARQFWSRRKFNAALLDLKPLEMRPDAHVGNGDCLHWCLPGALGLVPRLLQHVLTAAAEAEHPL